MKLAVTVQSFVYTARAYCLAPILSQKSFGRMGDDGYSFVPRPVYDGRRVQRAFERDTIDYNSCIIKHLQNRVLFRDARDRVMPRAHATFAPQVETPQAWADAPETSFCTRHAKTQRNKPRPAPFFVVLYNADGQRLMTGQSSGELVMWNSLTFKFECALQAHNMSVHTMVWTHNSQFLVTGDAEGKIRYFQQSLNKVSLRIMGRIGLRIKMRNR